MTRTQANAIATEVIKSHLNPPWYMHPATTRLTMRGVKIRNAIATRLLQAYRDGLKHNRR